MSPRRNDLGLFSWDQCHPAALARRTNPEEDPDAVRRAAVTRVTLEQSEAHEGEEEEPADQAKPSDSVHGGETRLPRHFRVFRCLPRVVVEVGPSPSPSLATPFGVL